MALKNEINVVQGEKVKGHMNICMWTWSSPLRIGVTHSSMKGSRISAWQLRHLRIPENSFTGRHDRLKG